MVMRCFEGSVEWRSVPNLPDDLTVTAAQVFYDRLKIIDGLCEIMCEASAVQCIFRRLAVAARDHCGQLAGNALVAGRYHTHKVDDRTWHA